MPATSRQDSRAEWLALAEWAETESRALRARASGESDEMRRDLLVSLARICDGHARASRVCAEMAR